MINTEMIKIEVPLTKERFITLIHSDPEQVKVDNQDQTSVQVLITEIAVNRRNPSRSHPNQVTLVPGSCIDLFVWVLATCTV